MIDCTATIEAWPLSEPFEIAGTTYDSQRVVLVTLTDRAGRSGRGEAAGVDYDGETPERMLQQIHGVAERLAERGPAGAAGFSGELLLTLLPKGGARNALDCALWDLRAKQAGVPAWKLAGLAAPQPLLTAVTIGLCDETTLRRRLRALRTWPLLKLKLDAQRHLDVVRIAREEHPGARLIVDANQAWSRPLLERLLPPLAALGVELVEQPLPQGADADLDGLASPIALAADESCRDRQSLAALVGRYQHVNLKLDKSGGLTEALAMVREARRLGLGLMVGNMCGSSLAMAPAFLLGQHCRYVDLDGPLLQRQDRQHPLRYDNGWVMPPEAALWG